MFLSFLPMNLLAQPGGNGCGDIGDPDAPCPVDGGLVFLLAAGVVFGAKKVKDNRNKKTIQIM